MLAGRVAGDRELAPGPGLAEDLVGHNRAPVGKRHGNAALQFTAHRPVGHAERIGRLDVEPTGPSRFDQRPAERRDAVPDIERRQPIVVAFEYVARFELDQPDVVAQLSDHALQRATLPMTSRRRHPPATHEHDGPQDPGPSSMGQVDDEVTQAGARPRVQRTGRA